MRMKGLFLTAACSIVVLVALLGLKNRDMRDKPQPSTYVLPVWNAIPDYPFLKKDLNEITFFGDSSNFELVFDKLDRIIFEGKGRLNVLHMGGSHVQGGTLSNRLRENFQSLGEGLIGPRGFVFPYRLAHTNSPGNLKVDYTGDWNGFKCTSKKLARHWGLSGYEVETTDSLAQIKLWSIRSDSTCYPFNRVMVFYEMDGQSYNLMPDTNMRYVVGATDSVAQYTEFIFEENCDTLFLRLNKTDSLQRHFILRGILLDNDQPGLVYHAIGVNGASVPSYLRCVNLEKELESVAPDLVIFGIGINDAYGPYSSFSKRDFEQHYDSLIQRILNVNPQTAFLFLSNNDSYYKRRYANKNGVKVRESMMSLAEKYHGGFWDLFEIMGGLNSIRSWEHAGLAKRDKIHLTRPGYYLQADLMHDAFRKRYGEHLENKYKH